MVFALYLYSVLHTHTQNHPLSMQLALALLPPDAMPGRDEGNQKIFISKWLEYNKKKNE